MSGNTEIAARDVGVEDIACTHIYLHMYMYAYMCTHMYVHTYIYVYTYMCQETKK